MSLRHAASVPLRAMTPEYQALIFPPRMPAARRRNLQVVRTVQLVTVIFAVGLFFPPIWLAVVLIPWHLRRYDRALQRQNYGDTMRRMTDATRGWRVM